MNVNTILFNNRFKSRTLNLNLKIKLYPCLKYVKSDDGRQCVSASSDGTVRLWSIGEQRVVRVFQISEQGIWTLAVDPNFRWVYAAGKQADITGKYAKLRTLTG